MRGLPQRREGLVQGGQRRAPHGPTEGRPLGARRTRLSRILLRSTWTAGNLPQVHNLDSSGGGGGHSNPVHIFKLKINLNYIHLIGPSLFAKYYGLQE